MTPEELERYGYGNESLFLGLEQKIMNDIARRIASTGVITRSADFQTNQLKRLGMSDKDIKESLRATLNASDAYIQKIYEEAIRTDYISNKELYKAIGAEQTPFHENDFIQQLVMSVSRQTQREMHNMTGSLGFITKNGAVRLADYWTATLDRITSEVAAGAFDVNSTLRRAVKEMTDSGVRWIDFESGYHSRITVAARRSVMTGLSNMASKVADYNAEKLDTDTFEVSAHAGARPEHAEWQGKVFTRKELVAVCGLGTVTGLQGANCYHLYYPFIHGVSKRAYTDRQLAQWRAGTAKEYRGRDYTPYEAKQRQRALETRMRAQRETIKLLKDNEGDPLDIMFAQSRYRATMSEYVRFCRSMGLKEQRERIYMDGFGKLGSEKKRGLYTKEEAGTIKKYIGSYSYKINEKLRTNKNFAPEDENFIKTFDSALSKTKIYKGEVNRSLSFMYKEDLDSFIKMHQTDFPVKYSQYISATTDLMYNEDGQVQIHILSRTGKDLREYNSKENEIVFERGVIFTVKHIAEKDGCWIIWLAEE